MCVRFEAGVKQHFNAVLKENYIYNILHFIATVYVLLKETILSNEKYDNENTINEDMIKHEDLHRLQIRSYLPFFDRHSRFYRPVYVSLIRYVIARIGKEKERDMDQ